MGSTSSSQLNRRDFLKGTAAAAVAAGVGLQARQAQGQGVAAPPSETVKLAFIGVAGRGMALMNDFLREPDVVITDICDVHQGHLDAAVQRSGGRARKYNDFRELLQRSSADAVVVATPPHWHPLISLAAMEAGKDVYCEKPMSLKVDEGLLMARAAEKYGRMTQVGTQIHSMDNFRRVVEIVRSGALGKISAVRTMVTLNEFPGNLGDTPDTPVPAGLDWEMWIGPLQNRPFNQALFDSGGHRYFRDCVGSWVNELGPHIMDLAFWAMDPGIPNAATAAGGRYALQDISTIPDTVEMLFEYPDFTMTFSHTAANGYNFGFGGAPDKGRRLAVFFHGTNGTLAADYGSHKLYLEGMKEEDFQRPEPSIPSSPGHQREFLDSVKSRQLPSCHFGYHLPLATAIAMGHAALFSGERIGWDAGRQRVMAGREGMREAMSDYRSPWKLPRV